ncbi:MAG: homoserine dehydrogenase [Candidatus Omnitrophica bacterium]|nr:homoserine dehydrogenase [Candidatus Omnitrophota bacterium]
MKSINIGLIGFGTVGSGVVKILQERRKLLKEKIGVEIILKKICDKNIAANRPVKVEKGLLTTNADEILDDPGIDIVVELIGGIRPAGEFLRKALLKGKHVVTANKALLAEEGQALFNLAREKGRSIYFEASVGAGISKIKAVREGLVANKFQGVFGIVNGTSNYILSLMAHQDCSFNAALAEAKKKGYAEANPFLDIEGIDSAHKLILLTYLCFGRFVSLKDVFVEGISRISLLDIDYAKELGWQIKLLAIAKKSKDKLEVRVHPTLIPEEHPLSSISGINNAIYVHSDLVGSLLFYGPGAGWLSAASAVVADIVDLTKDIKAGLFKPTLNILPDTSIKGLLKIDEIESRYYIRFMTEDKPGVLASISGILGKFGISIASVTQKERKKVGVVPIVMILHEAKEKNIRQALEQINKLKVVKDEAVAIRIEETF